MKDVLTIVSLFIILLIAAALNSVTSASAINGVANNTNSNGLINGNPIYQAVSNNITLSEDTEDLSLLSQNIKWTPDSHITYITFPDKTRRYFISGNQKTYYLDTKSSKTLAEGLKDNPKLIQSFGPDINVVHRNGYSTISSVLQIDKTDANHVIGFTQNEQQKVNSDGSLDFGNFTTSIGLLESYDGGKSWNDLGPVIRGDDYLAPGTRISGAGQPCAIIVNNYVYIYYANWASQTKVFHADQIYLARIKILGGGKRLDKFEFYKEGGFSEGEFNLKPVILADAIENGKYSAIPSISYNNALKKYLAFYETDMGFAIAFSQDGITWTDNKLIFYFPKPISQRQNGDLWYSYPSLLSDKTENNDQTTSFEGNLYYSQGIWPTTAHQLIKKEFNF